MRNTFSRQAKDSLPSGAPDSIPFGGQTCSGQSAEQCGGPAHFHRRSALKFLGLSGLAWLTPLAEALSLASERSSSGRNAQLPAKSLILLWLDGGPSQLETFDPHAGRSIAEGTAAISTSARGIELAAGLPRTAEIADQLAIVRNVVTKEGDHERATYNVKNGFRPDPTLIHPSIGAVLAHQRPAPNVEIPQHISIMPNQWPGRGGYLGDAWDAFKTGDPAQPIPDLTSRVSEDRFRQRLRDLKFLNHQFANRRLVGLDEQKTLDGITIERSQAVMSSEQLAAFDVQAVPRAERLAFGDSAFGRGCLAAARLDEIGVRCIEVTLGGWDLAHASNHTVHRGLTEVLDPALAALIRYLRDRDQLDSTMVMCCGEFGRTPRLNGAGGRDHWPHGFSVALAGGGVAGGRVLGQTDPHGGRVDHAKGTPIEDVHATVMHAMGIDPARELDTPVGRPMKLSEGRVLRQLLS